MTRTVILNEHSEVKNLAKGRAPHAKTPRRGLGAEALRMWIDYLFTSLDLHRIGTETWSGNVRMMRCAEKCGFVLEGRLREVVEVCGRRYDGVKFGLLRREWEATYGPGL